MPRKKVPENSAEATLDKKNLVESQKEQEPIKPQPSHKNQAESEYPRYSAKAEEYALSLSQKLDQSNINIDRLQIKINDQIIFGMKNGDLDRKQTNISDKQAELIKQALNDPTSFEGSMKITQGSKVLLHIKDGKVLVDSARLVQQSAKVELNTPDLSAKQMYQQYSEGVNHEGLAKTKQTAMNAFQDGVSREDVTRILRTEDEGYKKLVSSAGEQLANKSLNQIVNSAIAKTKIKDNVQQQQVQKEKTVAQTLTA